ncbi:TATE DNA Transposon [Leptomonas pyrrhocoris]|uniref:TATE DNA Transposon n=1 Tax=Leptomonas pyrrhocoris TaxID=157538 RepID=A0A0N1J4K2_LEPPY|nr:TATE DNA Transposon [Leptomonas pyrrhocoris]KPA77632.1 TATE DNA Transposon [Leptomonas pyrrhocoris]|eukprot:XP_015656071.1 TATE DNA Transposon [Leptomonas pyrrhocoris]
MQGVARPVRPPPPSEWRLHLKATTPLCIEAVKTLPTAHTRTHHFLRRVLRYMDAAQFAGLRTSRTIKPTRLPAEDIRRAVEMGKFELCAPDLVGVATGRWEPDAGTDGELRVCCLRVCTA